MIRIVFFGTPDIGLESIDYLYTSDKIDVLAVVTQPDKPAGRGNKIQMSPIKKYALEHNIPVFQPESIRKEPHIQEELKKLEPDFFVTFAFGQILSQEVLDIPKYETINLHASLLPKYRGANPIQRAIINGDKETGICTMITELGLDCGDICQKLVIPISDDMNCEEYRGWLKQQDNWAIGKDLPQNFVPQVCFWLIANDIPVGFGKIRMKLTEKSRLEGGNLGYAIDNRQRGKGYGSLLLAKLLQKAKDYNLTNPLITVKKFNYASKKVAESNGAILIKETEDWWYFEVNL